MSERNIKLTIVEEDEGAFSIKQGFVISIGDSGVEIRRAREPVATRDRSVSVSVSHAGHEPRFVELTLHVEEAP